MSRSEALLKFLLFYLFVFLSSTFLNYYLTEAALSESSSAERLLIAVSQTTMTHVEGSRTCSDVNVALLFASVILTQINGLVILAILYWLYLQLFGTDKDKNCTISRAFATTLIVIAICEICLFAFYLYSMPLEISDDNLPKKILAALTLTVNTFCQAGISYHACYFHPGVLDSNFMIHIGIVGGILLSGLGIFVIIELFSPAKLRTRLDDQSVDWSPITKLSVFGSAIMLVFQVLLLYILEEPATPKMFKMMDQIALVLADASSGRGFGLDFISKNSWISQSGATLLGSLGSGPFSTGGGLTLIGILFIVRIFFRNRSSNFIETGYRISKNWFLITAIFLIITVIAVQMIATNISFYQILRAYLTLSIYPPEAGHTGEYLILMFTNLIGRISFIIACIMALPKHN